MKLIKPKAELLLQQPDLKGVYKQIELAGRTCYKSTDKITEDSAKPFVDRMINSNHLAMLEHGTVYLKDEFVGNNGDEKRSDLYKFRENKYSKLYSFWFPAFSKVAVHVTTNLRVLVENGWLDDLKYICEPTECHEKRYTFRLTTSIGVTRELNRHRVNSIAEQSTRYCNYSKDKFGNEVAVCIPSWLNLPEMSVKYDDGIYIDTPGLSIGDFVNESSFLWEAAFAESQYFELLEQGWQPQQAREVLPLCTATEAVYTAFTSDWKHFFDLRYFGTTGAPHPNMVELTNLMANEAEKYGIWKELCNENTQMAN